jgi:hypothetical protein
MLTVLARQRGRGRPQRPLWAQQALLVRVLASGHLLPPRLAQPLERAQQPQGLYLRLLALPVALVRLRARQAAYRHRLGLPLV